MSTNNFSITNFIADYRLEKTPDNVGKIVSTENITAVFPETNQNHGITRTFLMHNQNGRTATKTGLKFSATRNGTAENIAKWDNDGNYLTAYLGNEDVYIHNTQEYTLNYEIENIITNFPADEYYDQPYQQLYWNTNGTGTTVPIDYLESSVHLPSDAPEVLGTSCYVGRYGESGQSRCTTEKTLDGYKFSTSNLHSGENLTFVVDFAGQNYFTIPEKPVSFIAIGGIIISVLLGILILFLTYKGKWQATAEKRHYTKDAPVPPQYTPLKNYTVADFAEISLETTKSPKVATLLELAVNHKIALKNTLTKWIILVKNTTGLSADQSAALAILNDGKTAVDGEEIVIKNHSYSSALSSAHKRYDNAPTAHLKTTGALESSTAKDNQYEKILTGILGWAIVLGVIGTSLYFFVGESFFKDYISALEHGDYNIIGASYFPYAIFFLICSATVSLFITGITNKYKVRTMKGLELDNYLRGLKLYIKMAEKDRLKFLQGVKTADTTPAGIVKLYEKLLPYAALFGLEKSWMKELSHYYQEYDDLDHSWYVGTNAFLVSDLSRAMRSMNSSFSSGTVAPGSGGGLSSGSSGSGGGGFSGGGSGGGGVGGW